MNIPEATIKRLIHESNLIEGYDRDDYDKQSLLAWHKLMPLDFKSLTHYDVMKTQKIITLLQDDMQPHWRGYYRDVSNQRVWVGGREGVAPMMVPAHMDNWLLDYRNADPIQHHIKFEKIHPFVDGNGRTGRMLLWWMQMRRDEPLAMITFEGRQQYYGWFK